MWRLFRVCLRVSVVLWPPALESSWGYETDGNKSRETVSVDYLFISRLSMCLVRTLVLLFVELCLFVFGCVLLSILYLRKSESPQFTI
jgi:hypothetical protein